VPTRTATRTATAPRTSAVTVGRRGSRCDTFKQKCTLPFRDRVAQAGHLVLHSRDNDDDYFEPSARRPTSGTSRCASPCRRPVRRVRATGERGLLERYPVYVGQQDDNDDAISLAREVDDCRRPRLRGPGLRRPWRRRWARSCKRGYTPASSRSRSVARWSCCATARSRLATRPLRRQPRCPRTSNCADCLREAKPTSRSGRRPARRPARAHGRPALPPGHHHRHAADPVAVGHHGRRLRRPADR
jgi:hypothetical protein